MAAGGAAEGEFIIYMEFRCLNFKNEWTTRDCSEEGRERSLIYVCRGQLGAYVPLQHAAPKHPPGSLPPSDPPTPSSTKRYRPSRSAEVVPRHALRAATMSVRRFELRRRA